MNFVDYYIGKNLSSIEITDLQTYFQDVKHESDTIEYKSYFIRHQNNHKHKENSIIKTICGMLNSEGGMIIWGSPIEQTNDQTQRKEFNGELSLLDRIIDKDSFVSRISQSIVPLPTGIKLRIATNGNECACVIEVQKSESRPHRFDGRYWVRLDGQTQLAPHHYVEALIKEVRYPIIECYLKVEEYKKEEWTLYGLGFQRGKQYIWIAIRYYIFNWSGHINEEDVMLQIVTERGKFLESIYPHKSSNYRFEGKVYRPSNVHDILYYGEPLTENFYIIMDPEEVKGVNEFDLIMTIGGRKSPQKWSTYRTNLAQLESGNINEGLTIIEENKLVIDSHSELGKTKNQILNDLLGRETTSNMP